MEIPALPEQQSFFISEHFVPTENIRSLSQDNLNSTLYFTKGTTACGKKT